MTRPELRVFLQTWFCGCGSPDLAAAYLLRLLDLHPLYEHRQELEALISDTGLEMLILYTLDRFDLTEHGGTVGGAWLSPKGEAVREALRAESGDKFVELSRSSCIHGYVADMNGHEACAECDKPQVQK